MNPKNNKNQHGFVLLDTLVAIFIASLCLSVIGNALGISSRSTIKSLEIIQTRTMTSNDSISTWFELEAEENE